MARENPFRARVMAASELGAGLVEEALAERRRREEVGFGTLAEASGEFRPSPGCPACGSGRTRRGGRTPSWAQGWECLDCGRRHDSLAGTVFEHARHGLPKWVSFIRLVRLDVPLERIAESLGVSRQTAWEWRHRAFATVDGYQDGVVPGGRVWIGGPHASDTDLARGCGQARKRGLSGQRLCIVVAIDAREDPVAVVCGHGKPSTARARAAPCGHLARRCTVTRDRGRAHNGVLRDAAAESEAYEADVRDPACLERMAMADNLCSWLKRYLWRFTGMSAANMQSYLNWYVYLFRVNQEADEWPETARVVRHMLMANASFRSST
jgi:transposase-like protein